MTLVLPKDEKSIDELEKLLARPTGDKINPMHLMIAIEPESYDLLFNGIWPRPRKHVTELYEGVREGLEKFQSEYVKGLDAHMAWTAKEISHMAVMSFLGARYNKFREQHDKLPFAPARSMELSTKLHLEGPKKAPLNPPPTRVENAICIYDISREDMRVRTHEWLKQIIAHEGHSRDQIATDAQRRARKSQLMERMREVPVKALVFIAVMLAILYFLRG